MSISKPIKRFNKSNVKELNEKIDRFLYELSKEYQINLGRYATIEESKVQPHTFHCKFMGLTGFDAQKEAKKWWDKRCRRAYLKPSHFMKEVTIHGITYLLWEIRDNGNVMGVQRGQSLDSTPYLIGDLYLPEWNPKKKRK